MKTQLRLAMVLAVAACTSPAFAQNTGAATYTSKCQMCHGADGAGTTPAGKAMKAPSFLSPAAKKESTADLIAVTKNGKGKMPAYAGKLTDAEIKDVIAHVRTLQK
ncbi:MAG: cytochrome c [Acidobacteriota bacterium]|nr:cytochrome c [Acidobacteriota bacterium]